MLYPFTVHRPQTLDQAASLLHEFGDDATTYAGGTELLLAMRMGVLHYGHLVDVKGIEDMRGIAQDHDTLRIGATITHGEIEGSPRVRSTLPALADLERSVANVRVRAVGTLGGNLAFGEPHADPPTLLTALRAEVEVSGMAGSRTIPMTDLIVGPYETALAEDEVIVAVRVPIPGPSVKVAYARHQILERPAACVAIVASIEEDQFVSAPAIVVGAVEEVPRQIPCDQLAGRRASDAKTVAQVAESARELTDPIQDLSGGTEFKRHLVEVMVGRLLASVAGRQAP